MTINDHINSFAHYLDVERGFSPRTVKAYRHDLGKLIIYLDTLEVLSIQDVTKEHIRAFLSAMAKHNAKITYARKLSTIKSFFKYLTREKFLETNPAVDVESPKIPEKEPCYLSEAEYRHLINTVKWVATPYYQFRDIAIVTVFLHTGIRLAELVGLTLNSVDLAQRHIVVTGKGNKQRMIPLNDEAIAALEKYLPSRPEVATDKLFVSRKGNGLSSGSVYHLIKKYLEAAEIKKAKVGVHSLRHSFGASLLNKGTNLVVIQELFGHKKLETTRRYLHINNADLRTAVDKLSVSQ